MSVIEHQQSRLNQPPPAGPLGIDRNHWLASRLRFAWWGTGAWSRTGPIVPAVSDLPAVVGGGSGNLAGSMGVAPDGTGFLRFDLQAFPAENNTLVCWHYAPAGSTNDTFLAIGNATASDGCRSLNRSTSETYNASRISNVGAYASATGSGFTSGRWVQLVGRFTNATTSAIGVDGVVTEATGNSRPATTANAVFIGTDWVNGGTTRLATATIPCIGLCMVIEGQLTDEEIAFLYREQMADPWGFLDLARVGMPLASGGGGGPTNHTGDLADSLTLADARVVLLGAAGGLPDSLTPADIIGGAASRSGALSDGLTLADQFIALGAADVPRPLRRRPRPNLRNGLLGLWRAGRARSDIGPEMSYVGTNAPAIERSVPVRRFNASAYGGFPARGAGGEAVTLMVAGSFDTAGLSNYVAGVSLPGVSTYLAVRFTSGALFAELAYSGGGSVTLNLGAYTAGTRVVIAVRYRYGQLNGWLNGRLAADNDSSAFVTVTGAVNYLTVNAAYIGSTFFPAGSGSISAMAAWRRWLSDAELLQLGGTAESVQAAFRRGPALPYWPVANNAAHSGALADTLMPAEVRGGVASMTVGLADSATLTEALTGGMAAAAHRAEDLTVADAPAGSHGQLASLADTALVLADAAAAGSALSGALVDTLAPDDAPDASMAGAHSGARADTLTVLDTLTGMAAWTVALADALTLADTPAGSKATQAVLTDTLAPVDAAAGIYATAGSLADSLVLVDHRAYVGDTTFSGALADLLVLVDVAAGVLVTPPPPYSLSNTLGAAEGPSLSGQLGLADGPSLSGTLGFLA